MYYKFFHLWFAFNNISHVHFKTSKENKPDTKLTNNKPSRAITTSKLVAVFDREEDGSQYNKNRQNIV